MNFLLAPKPDMPPAESPLLLDDLRWSPEEAERSLARVYRHVSDSAHGAIDWYVGAIRRKRWLAYSIRFTAILLIAVAGLIPLLESVHEKYATPSDGAWLQIVLDTAWATVILAVAASLVGLDRFFGYSSGWMRFIRAELELRRLVAEFELDWQRHRASWRGGPPLPTQVELALHRCKEMSRQVNAIVGEETTAWIQEFQTSLRHADEALRQQMAEWQRRSDEDAGAMNVVVTNGDQCEGRRWILSVDSESGAEFVGRTAALTGLKPGMHHIRVFGVIGGEERQAQQVGAVPRGGVNQVELTLS